MMAVLLNAATSNTDRASATGTATADAVDQIIEIPGDSVFDGAYVAIEVSSANTAAKFSGIDTIGIRTSPGNFSIRVPIGHFVRAALANAGASTSVTVNMFAID